MLDATSLLSKFYSAFGPPLKITRHSRNNLKTSLTLFPLKTTLNNNSTKSIVPQESRTNTSSLLSFYNCRKSGIQKCLSVLNSENFKGEEKFLELNGNGKENRKGTFTWVLLLMFYGALWCFALFISPDNTQEFDMYFLKKLFNLEGDVKFKINEVFMTLWYMLGLWPFCLWNAFNPIRSKSRIPVWPFLVLSFTGGGIYVLMSYFLLWSPPPPPIEETELKQWPLKFLESKLTPAIILVAGLGLILSAALSTGDMWKEFLESCGKSRLVLLSSLDFFLLSAFAPFWVYNDMTARKWYGKGSWLLPLTLVPLLGPVLYLMLRPSLSELMVSVGPSSSETNK